MSTLDTPRHAVALESLAPLAECSECLHLSVVITQFYAATRIDPECSAGYCTCAQGEMLSVCCGAPEHPDVEGFCSACNDGTGFERECPCGYEFG